MLAAAVGPALGNPAGLYVNNAPAKTAGSTADVNRILSSQPVKRVATLGGRQPGSISRRWRQIMADLLTQHPLWFPVGAIVNTVAVRENRKVRPAEARRQFHGYIEHGYVEKNSIGLYRVTETAIQKFDLASLIQDRGSGRGHS